MVNHVSRALLDDSGGRSKVTDCKAPNLNVYMASSTDLYGWLCCAEGTFDPYGVHPLTFDPALADRKWCVDCVGQLFVKE